jgi:hypothetical protein
MWYKDKTKELRDFARFGRAMILSGDIDPQFPILRYMYEKLELDRNTALWWTCIYLLYYHLGSAIQAWKRYPKPDIIRKKDWSNDLPYFKQRRCFRGNEHARNQINTLVALTDGDMVSWIDNLVSNNREKSWTRIRETISELPYHGPWSSYKFCDLMKFVHSYDISAPDIGTKPGATAGPIAGLNTLTGLDWNRCADDSQLHRDLLQMVINLGTPVNGLDQLESMLCDWQSLTNGRYYLGHDIDRDQVQLQLHNSNLSGILWEARRDIFDERLLGEYGGWSGPRGYLKSVYRDRRRLIHDFSDIKVVKTV